MRLTQEDKLKLNSLVTDVINNPVKHFKLELTDQGRMQVSVDEETIADFFEMPHSINEVDNIMIEKKTDN